NSVLVPIDISESDLTHRVVPYVQAHSAMDTAHVHFLTVIPSLPYYSSFGIAYSSEMPRIDELRQDALSKLNEVVKQFNLPASKFQTHAISGSPKDEILQLAEAVS